MKMEDSDLFAEVRSLLHGGSPTVETRRALGDLLKKAYQEDEEVYQEQWLPYLEAFEVWWSVPLFFITSNYLRVDTLKAYKALFPATRPVPWMYVIETDRSTSFPGLESVREDLQDLFGEFSDEELATCCRIRVDDLSYSICGSGADWWDHYPGGSRVIELLLENQGRLPALHSLEFVGCADGYELNDEGDSWEAFDTKANNLSSLFSSEMFSRLRHVHIMHKLSSRDARLLKDQEAWSQMRHIDLSRNLLSERTVREVFPTLMPELTHLNLSHNVKLNALTVGDLLETESFPALEVLDLQGCPEIRAQDAQALLEHPGLPSLQAVLV